MKLRLAVAALAALLIACSTQPAAEASPKVEQAASVHPISGLQIIPLKIATGKGSHAFRVEVAATQEAQTRGLMFRQEVGPDEGMIFPSQVPQQRNFWMRNTPIPLDIIFVGADRRIVNIAANATPYSLDSIPSDGPVIMVLEIAGGRAAELGVGPGDKVEW